MSAIYTRTGDDGTTSLGDGERVSKVDRRVEAYGTVDEACSAVGVARSECDDEMLRDVLRFVQQRLMNCSSALADPSGASSARAAAPEDVAFLERTIDLLEQRTGALDHFIVPGGCTLAAQLQAARAVVRRAERRVFALEDPTAADADAARFLNRSSDLLFAVGRYANAQCSRADLAWDPSTPPPDLTAYHSD